jgi:gamma-D-glutamyl-L-lysine dipeptidyl-peptidase
VNKIRLVVSLALTLMVAACSSLKPPQPGVGQLDTAARALAETKSNSVPDTRLAVFNVGVQASSAGLVLTGEVDRAELRSQAVRAVSAAGINVTDHIRVLPAEELGDQTWGIACLSVASGRSAPEHKTEMVTQVLMGNGLRVLKHSRFWYYAQSTDGYLAWFEKGTFTRCTREELDAWEHAPCLIVTAFEETVLERPENGAEPVSDVVICDLLQRTGEQGDWFQVRLPDGREGFLPRKAAEDFGAWRQKCQPTAQNLERTARRFLGRPYLWGGVSPKGLDCSGFTKLVFYLNGISLNRDASEQALQGREVPLDENLSQLKKGDLLFFGRDASWGGPQRIVHVGLYMGDKLFIHSSERVQISSLDPASPNVDRLRLRTLIRARRILND